MSGPVLSLRSVVRVFAGPGGERRVADGIELDLQPGEIVTVFGRSGSGKSTLLAMAAGLEPPDRGAVLLGDGRPAAAASWSEVALVPQALGLLDELTVEENVRLPLRLPAASGRDPMAVDDLLARLGLAHLVHRRPSEVSVGEQQRTALARAAVLRPDVVIADEPVAHQNRVFVDAVMGLLVDLAASGSACLLASHDAAVAGVASRVLRLDDGRLARDRS